MSSTTIILLIALAVVVVSVLSLRPGAARNPRQGQTVVWVVIVLAAVLALGAYVLGWLG